VQTSITRTDTAETAHREIKKGIKAVSFISRLMGGAKKKDAKDADEESVGEESSSGELRPEGNDAEVFAQSIDNMSYNARHPQPPSYIKVRSRFKARRDFDRLFLAQELTPSALPPKLERRDTFNKLKRKGSTQAPDGNTVWAMEFSRDGKYLATAGADMVVRVWSVLTSMDDRHQLERQESRENEVHGGGDHAEHLSAPVFHSKPLREYHGHTATILDLSWSKNNFLLSSSMDKTVRLWHVSRSDSILTFNHNDHVPSIAFHPKDDRFFLAGSLDSRLRLWSIATKSVAYMVQVPDMITAVAFTPDGKHAMAGCLSGLCTFYETEGLKYQSQIHVRSSRGQNAKASKITGIRSHYGPCGDIKVLITSNDSRIRLYNFRDKSLELKLRGGENNHSQIRATVSDDAKYVVCGSEDHMAYLWSLDHPQTDKHDKRDKIPVEMFEAHNTIATVVCIAPTKTRQHLSKSEDPVYDMCNPPPVMLLSRAERQGSRGSGMPDSPADGEIKINQSKDTLAHAARSVHKSGHIIITADFLGKIKVFRQDCGWSKRRQDDWDKSSIFTKRSGKLSRTESFATRTSQRSLINEKRTSVASQAPSERIISWRTGVSTYPGAASSAAKQNRYSTSSRRSVELRSRADPYKSSDSSLRSSPVHPLAMDTLIATSLVASPSPIDRDPMESAGPSPAVATPPRPLPSPQTQLSGENPLDIVGGQSYAFWDLERIRQDAERWRKQHEAGTIFHAQCTAKLMGDNGELENAATNGDEGVGATADADSSHAVSPSTAHPDHLAVQPPQPGMLQRMDTFVTVLSDEQDTPLREHPDDSDDDTFDDARDHQEPYYEPETPIDHLRHHQPSLRRNSPHRHRPGSNSSSMPPPPLPASALKARSLHPTSLNTTTAVAAAQDKAEQMPTTPVDEPLMHCLHCGSISFSARTGKDGGPVRWICLDCGIRAVMV
jgi:WD40 repeat protein